MSKIGLDLNQIKYLNKLGINTDNGSVYLTIIEYPSENGTSTQCFYSFYKVSVQNMACENATVKVIPTFSLQDIWNLLPEEIICENNMRAKLYIHNNSIYYKYEDEEVKFVALETMIRDKQLIDAAYDMLCKLVEDGYINVNKL